MPVAPHAAVIPGKYYHTGYRRRITPPEAVFQADDKQTAYTEVINLMNYSAAVIPMTKADKAIDVVPEGDDAERPLNDVDKQNWEACKSFPFSPPLTLPWVLTPGSADDPEIYDGAPVGVQIVARKFEEEKVLATAGIVTACLKRGSLL